MDLRAEMCMARGVGLSKRWSTFVVVFDVDPEGRLGLLLESCARGRVGGEGGGEATAGVAEERRTRSQRQGFRGTEGGHTKEKFKKDKKETRDKKEKTTTYRSCLVRESVAPRLEKAMEDLLPWRCWGMSRKKLRTSNILK